MPSSTRASGTDRVDAREPGVGRRSTLKRHGHAGARRSRRRGGSAAGAWLVALGARSRGASRWARWAGVIVVAMLVMAVFAEQIAPYGYDETIRGARMKPPSAAHWLGTDNLSRDMWSRIVYGARVSITMGFLTIAPGRRCWRPPSASRAPTSAGAWDLRGAARGRRLAVVSRT